MKLKHRLILGFMALIFTLYLITGLLHYFILENATKKHIQLAKDCEKQLETLDVRAPFEALLPYYRDYICMDNELTAQAVGGILRDEGEQAVVKLQQNGVYLSAASRHFFLHEQQEIERMLISKDSFCYVCPDTGTVDIRVIKKQYPDLAELLEDAEISGESSGDFFCVDPATGQTEAKFISVVKVPDFPYLVASAVFMPKLLKPLLAELHRKQKEEFLLLQQDMDQSFDMILVKMMLTGLLLTGVLSFIALLLSYRLAGSIARPIESLERAVQKIGQGNFDIHVDEIGSVETRSLARRFNHLGEQLTDYIARLEKEMRSRQIVENEIHLVARIQADALPKMTPEFCRDDFALTARLIPAREAAGDFYDFRYLSEKRLLVMVADIAGKDLSASFFMMKAKTLLSIACDHYPDNPAMALTRTNEVLAKGNSECMFLTLFLAYCDLDSGQVHYANAGHHETVRLHPGKTPQTFGAFRNPPLGFTGQSVYEMGTCHLEAGDMLLMYTDGVTEAQGPGDVLYGDERLLSLCAECSGDAPEVLCQKILNDVRDFETETQSDDITLLAFKWTPESSVS